MLAIKADAVDDIEHTLHRDLRQLERRAKSLRAATRVSERWSGPGSGATSGVELSDARRATVFCRDFISLVLSE